MMLVPANRNRSLFNEMMANPFESFFDTPVASGRSVGGLMKTDVKETDSAFQLTVELPGAKKEDVSAEIKDGYLTVSASTKRESEESEGSYIRKERFEGSSSRSFYIGDDIDEDAISAGFENGLLNITVPKKAQPQIEEGKTISID